MWLVWTLCLGAATVAFAVAEWRRKRSIARVLDESADVDVPACNGPGADA